MARQRMIRPEIWESEQVSKLSDFEFRIYIGLISHADDEGRLKASPVLLTAKIFPLTAQMDTVEKVRSAIVNMEAIGLVAIYGNHADAWIAHPKWTKWQYIPKAHRQKSALPGIPRRYESQRNQVSAYGYALKS